MSEMVAYLRVSTDRQGRSGLGLDAQRETIRRFADSEGLELVGEHVEIETGKGADALELRPQLRVALDKARKLNARSSSPSSTGSAVTLRLSQA